MTFRRIAIGDAYYSQDQARLKRLISDMESELPSLVAKYSDKGYDSKQIRRHLLSDDEVADLLNKYVGFENSFQGINTARSSMITQLVSYLSAKEPAIKDKSLERMRRNIQKGLSLQILDVAQQPLRQNITEDSIRKLLPPNIVVDVDSGGKIQDITERMGNKLQTMREKVSEMKDLIGRYNNVVTEVKKDLNSPDPFLKTCAVMTAVIMETGIRPGRPGNTSVKKEKGGGTSDVATFGASTLKLEHFIGELREDMVQIEFTGKRLVRNTATISNREIASVVKSYVDKGKKELLGASETGELPVFRTDAGNLVSYYDLSHYMRRKLGGLKSRDFRRLKATREFFNEIRKAQVAMRSSIQALVDAKVANLKAQVAEEVIKVVKQAYQESRASLSHEPQGDAIFAYINTEVVLSFLESGGLDDDFETVILSGAKTLKFDPDTFISKANGRTASDREYSLLEIMSTLSEDIAELNDLLGFEKI